MIGFVSMYVQNNDKLSFSEVKLYNSEQKRTKNVNFYILHLRK